MSIVTTYKNEDQRHIDIQELLKPFFDELSPIGVDFTQEPMKETFRVSKASQGLVYLADDEVTLEFRDIPASVLNSPGTRVCNIELASINGVSTGVTPVNNGQKETCTTRRYPSKDKN